MILEPRREARRERRRRSCLHSPRPHTDRHGPTGPTHNHSTTTPQKTTREARGGRAGCFSKARLGSVRMRASPVVSLVRARCAHTQILKVSKSGRHKWSSRLRVSKSGRHRSGDPLVGSRFLHVQPFAPTTLDVCRGRSGLAWPEDTKST